MSLSEVIFKISSFAAIMAFGFMLVAIRDASNDAKKQSLSSGGHIGAEESENPLPAVDADCLDRTGSRDACKEEGLPDGDSSTGSLSSTALAGSEKRPRKQSETDRKEAVHGLGIITVFLILVALLAALCSNRGSLNLDLTKKTALGETRVFSYFLGNVARKIVFFLEVPFLVAWELIKLAWGAVTFLPNLAYEFCLSLLLAMGLPLPLWVMGIMMIVGTIALSFLF